MGTPVTAGRDFDEHDVTSGSKVAVVNDAFAARFAGGRPVIGEHLWVEATPFEPSTRYEIVGVVKNAKYLNVREPFEPEVFVPLSQDVLKSPAVTIAVRSNAHTDAVIGSVRRTLDRSSAPLQYSFRPFDAIVAESLRGDRLIAALSAPFGALGMLLTMLGLYGVITYSVGQRTREIGIRIALGADPRRVALSVVREAAAVLAGGLAAGTLLTVTAAPLIDALLFGLQPYDARVLSFAVVVVAGVALMAAYAAARRATRVDPTVALRQE
jgi:hypothetical protein